VFRETAFVGYPLVQIWWAGLGPVTSSRSPPTQAGAGSGGSTDVYGPRLPAVRVVEIASAMTWSGVASGTLVVAAVTAAVASPERMASSAEPIRQVVGVPVLDVTVVEPSAWTTTVSLRPATPPVRTMVSGNAGWAVAVLLDPWLDVWGVDGVEPVPHAASRPTKHSKRRGRSVTGPVWVTQRLPGRLKRL